MVNILSPSGIEDPLGGEAHSRAMISRNWNRLNEQLPRFNTVNSTYSVNNIHGTASKFTRILFGPTKGIIIAEFALDIETAAITIAACTALPTKLPGLIPVGYRPKSAPHSIPMYGVTAVTNAGSQAVLQWGYDTDGAVLLRNNINSTYTTQVGTDMNFGASYEWDGIV